MDAIERLQDAHCDPTRTTHKRFRVLRNIGEAAPFFPPDEPVLCYGSGDGFEVEVWRLLGYAAFGCEISSKKRAVAAAHDIVTVPTLDDMRDPCNIYCAHTIEHLADPQAIIDQWLRMVQSTICCIFPIEPHGSKNPSHLAPVADLSAVRFPGLQTIIRTERWNDEREGFVIAKRC